MHYERAGHRYGAWVVTLYGKRKVFKNTGRKTLPQLDSLYVAKVPSPKSWDDYTRNLVTNAEEKLLGLLEAETDFDGT